MGLTVKLNEIIEAIELQPDESTSYLNCKTGEILTITEEDFNAAENEDLLEEYPEWQHDSIKQARLFLENEEDFISLPTKYDIHEYQIIERFSLNIKDKEISNSIYSAIKGKGAFGRFRNSIHRFGIEDEWYKYRDEAIRQIAIDWCNENHIKYEYDQ
jgi:hypothetical protein